MTTETTEPQTKAIILAGLEPITVIPESAFATRDESLEKAKACRAVFDSQTRDGAISARNTLKELRLQIDKFRSFAKAPITAAGKKVESIIADFSREIGCGSGESAQGPEEKRLNQLLIRYENELQREREAAEARRREEERLAREAEMERLREIARREAAAAQALRDAEEARQRAERARSDKGKESAAQAEAEAKAAAQKAQEDADRLALEAEQAELDRQQRQRDEETKQIELASQTSPVKTKEVFDYEVINAFAFAMAYPDLVRVEVKRREVLEAMNEGKFDCRMTEADKVGDWSNAHVSGDVYRAAPGLRIYRATKLK